MPEKTYYFLQTFDKTLSIPESFYVLVFIKGYLREFYKPGSLQNLLHEMRYSRWYDSHISDVKKAVSTSAWFLTLATTSMGDELKCGVPNVSKMC